MIVGVAVKLGTKVYSLPRPWRHAHLSARYCTECRKQGYKAPAGYTARGIWGADAIQGFVTDKGTFLDRIESKAEVIACGQGYNPHSPTLTSEDLW